MPEDNSQSSVTDTDKLPEPPKPPKTAKTPRVPKAQKTSKVKGVPNRHLHARTTFLYQAATYLTLQAATETQDQGKENIDTLNQASSDAVARVQPQSALALQIGTHLRAVSLKGQVRLSTGLKRTVCKTCNAILVPGQTSTQIVENESKGGRKPHADVLVIECSFCKSKKRFPVGAMRQQKKAKRAPKKKDTPPSEMSVDIEQLITSAFQTGTDQSASSS